MSVMVAPPKNNGHISSSPELGELRINVDIVFGDELNKTGLAIQKSAERENSVSLANGKIIRREQEVAGLFHELRAMLSARRRVRGVFKEFRGNHKNSSDSAELRASLLRR